MLRFVCVAFAFLVLSPTVSQARPSRAFSQASDCNVTMPCDFSISKTGRNQAAYNAQLPQRPERLVRSSRSRAEFGTRGVSRVDVAGAQIAGGRPSGCPRSFLWLWRGVTRVRPDRAGIEFGIQLASLSPDSARTGHGCRATRARIRPGAARRRGYLDGLRCQLRWSRNADTRALASWLYRRESARGVTATCKSGQRGLTRRRPR